MTSTALKVDTEERVDDRAGTIHERLTLILKKAGTLTPDLIIKDARSPQSPLHLEFDWNDKSAAHQHRLYQARRLIALHWHHVRTDSLEFDAPYFVRDPEALPGEQGYVLTASLVKEPELAMKAFMTEIAKGQSFLERARTMAEPLSLEVELESCILAIETLRKNAEGKILSKRKG